METRTVENRKMSALETVLWVFYLTVVIYIVVVTL